MPLITDINDETLNNHHISNNNENTINSKFKFNKKVKIKSGIGSMNHKMNTSEEIKIITDNFINANTGKIKSKVKNYYRSNTNLGYANGEGPTPNPQINIINNNHIYNNNIVKYSFFENRRKNYKKPVQLQLKKEKLTDKFEQQLRNGYDIRKKAKQRQFLNEIYECHKNFFENHKDKMN